MTPDELKASVKKLNAQATQAKMDLHDLSEELPIGWERIPEQAQKTFDAYAKLAEARKQLAAAG
ncbi:CCE_0567 family metalloprotein [Azoarcus sp. KH32C]|uniref:CCE_0567 family metalloprotein n=1 Tax=Azoarcus sp. KH32C TaxID=748247 RepID=UPI00023865B1|nr:CCE_0567 family metalloprotein [Azoarcus sp. KH32C]BAL23118.1 hypothetical protein AZKH_0779 [Azoarcus sp. KH32C]